MSRVGRQAITVPQGVEVNVAENNFVTVKGPQGELSFKFEEVIGIKVENNEISVTRPNDSLRNKSLHGTTRALLNNMVTGVTSGYTKILDIKGVGYRAQLKEPNTLVLNVGYSNPVEMEIPEGITIEIPKNKNTVVGEFAANVRKVRPPEPYLGKGIRYRDEKVLRKEGKTAK
jgi:large subunit ribosomal protein L6